MGEYYNTDRMHAGVIGAFLLMPEVWAGWHAGSTWSKFTKTCLGHAMLTNLLGGLFLMQAAQLTIIAGLGSTAPEPLQV